MRIAEIVLHQISLPLTKPYRVSFRTYTEFEPILVEARDDEGRSGWGEAYIPSGSTRETAESGWTFCREQAARIVGRRLADARTTIDACVPAAPFAATAMLGALDMLQRHPALFVDTELRVPLLTPVSGKNASEIAEEVERLLQTGYRTLKVKVGWDVQADLERVRLVQRAVAGRARITMDANRGYDEAKGRAFAAALDPEDIDLFEQPCEADEWEANAAVAAICPVPLMLDESIRVLADIDRAAAVPGVKFVKLKLKRIGGVERAREAMRRALEKGLDVCLGDGVATELMCWMEACAGRGFLRRAGDMNGFLKPRTRLLRNPLAFEKGAVVIRPGYWPDVDQDVVRAHRLRVERFAPVAASAA